MEFSVDQYFDRLAAYWGVETSDLRCYLNDLDADADFLSAINDKIRDVDTFAGVQFSSASQMRTYRILLYLATRVAKPEIFVETGVHNGMSSAFILLAMAHNDDGTLYSIDLPPFEQRIIDQGTRPMPKDCLPGWIIPEQLRERHRLHLGPAETLLPGILAAQGQVDLFVHDSDHCYSHVMFEIGLAWRYLAASGMIVIDNIEQNAAFGDFARGVDAPSMVVSTFNGPDRIWQHGLIRKKETENA